MRGVQRPRLDARISEPREQRPDRRRRARHGAEPWRVDGGELDAIGQPAFQLAGAEVDPGHRAGRLLLHQSSASGNDGQRVLQRHDAGQVRCDVFAEAVAEHGLRHHAPVLPERGKCNLGDEERRLRDARLGQCRVAVVGVQQAADVGADQRLKERRAAIDHLAEHRFSRVEAAAHAGMLAALAAEEEGDRPCAAFVAAAKHRRTLWFAQRGDGRGPIGRDERAALCERLPTGLQREGHVGKRLLGVRFEMGRETRARGVKRRLAACRQHEQLRFARHRQRGLQRRFLEHRVGVRATDAEGADAGAPRRAGVGAPGAAGRARREGAAIKLQPGVRCAEVDERRQQLVLQHEHGLDQAGHTGGGVEVAEIRLERTEAAEAHIGRRGAEGLGQCGDLDRVAERRRGAVCFEVADAARRHAGQRLRGCDHLDLAFDAWCGEAGLAGPVVVDRDAANHGVHRVAVGERLGQALEHHDAGARAGARATRFGVERPAMAIGRQDHAFLVQVTRSEREGQRDTAGERHVALAALQRSASDLDRHQRCRAGGLDRHARAAQPELVGHPRAQKVFVVAEHDLVTAHGLGERRVAQQLGVDVAVHARPRVHADRLRQRAGRVAGMLDRFPGAFEEHPVLRVDHLRLARRVAEEACIEELGLFNERAAPHVGRVRAQRRAHARAVEFGIGERRERLHAGSDVVPEAFEIGGLRETAGQSDNRNRVRRHRLCLALSHGIASRRARGRVAAPRRRWCRWCRWCRRRVARPAHAQWCAGTARPAAARCRSRAAVEPGA